VLDSPRADVSARNQAAVGIGEALEKQVQKLEGLDRTQLLKRALGLLSGRGVGEKTA